MKTGIALGTAKLGLPAYGIGSSREGTDVTELFKGAYALGIRELDTSPRYGDAEALIGRYHEEGNPGFRVSTKVDGLVGSDAELVTRSVAESLRRTNVKCFETVYLHQNELTIISNPDYLQALGELRRQGLAKWSGVSLYSREECQFATDCKEIDVIQIPLSILDTRFHREFVAKSSPAKMFVARSVFLQGALLNPDKAPLSLRADRGFQAAIQRVDRAAGENGLTRLGLAISFLRRLPGLKGAIVGTKCLQNLSAITEISDFPAHLFDEFYELAAADEPWKNPRNWSS